MTKPRGMAMVGMAVVALLVVVAVVLASRASSPTAVL